MNAKLTLSLDKSVINAAKEELINNNQSLSSMVEDYFRSLLAARGSQNFQTPIVSELKGLVGKPNKAKPKQLISDYLLDKYR